MNRNKLLVSFGAIFILIIIALIFWMQTGLKGAPNEVKLKFQIGFIQKMELSNDELLTELVQPIILSVQNPEKKNLISFCSIDEISSIKTEALTAPILGMNYIRYNFMSKEMYSIDDRLKDDEEYINNLINAQEFTQFVSAIKKNYLTQKRSQIIDAIDGKATFIINPNFEGTKKGVFRSAKLVKDHIVKQTNLFDDEKPVVVKIYVDWNGPKSYEIDEETKEPLIDSIIETETLVRTELTTTNGITPNSILNNVTLKTDRKFTWEGDASSIKIRISIPTLGISIVKTVNKNQKIDLSNKEKEQLLQVDDPKTDKISIQYLNPNTNKYSSVNVVGLSGSIHCYNFFDTNEN